MSDEELLKKDAADRIEEAQRRYFKSEKGRASQRRYIKSEKGKKTLSKVQKDYYQRKKEKEAFAEACIQYLQDNPDKTVHDFLKEYQNGNIHTC
jgi:hypothetical protein